MLSPSPFSSTVSAVVADKLLALAGHGGDSPTTIRRVAPRRNSRPTLRSSLFVPHDELEGEHTEDDEAERNRNRLRGVISLGEPGPLLRGGGLTNDEMTTDGEGRAHEQHGFRGRARSLSHTLGGLFYAGRGRRDTAGSAASDIETGSSPAFRRGDQSTETP